MTNKKLLVITGVVIIFAVVVNIVYNNGIDEIPKPNNTEISYESIEDLEFVPEESVIEQMELKSELKDTVANYFECSALEIGFPQFVNVEDEKVFLDVFFKGDFYTFTTDVDGALVSVTTRSQEGSL